MYPPSLGEPTLPFISDMYPHYNLLGKLFRESIVAKSGDKSAVRGYMVNLMYFTKPSRVKKIDVMDFIYSEIKFGVEEKRAPGYASFIQAFINRVVGEDVMRDHSVKSHGLFTPIFIRGPMLPEHGKNKDVREGPSSPRPSRRSNKQKDSKLQRAIKSIFLMCKSADARAHEANERTKQLAREANARRREQGERVDDGSSLEASALVVYDNPYASEEEVEEVQSHGAQGDDIPSASSHGSEDFEDY
jgi:hypothetical protein